MRWNLDHKMLRVISPWKCRWSLTPNLLPNTFLVYYHMQNALSDFLKKLWNNCYDINGACVANCNYQIKSFLIAGNVLASDRIRSYLIIFCSVLKFILKIELKIFKKDYIAQSDHAAITLFPLYSPTCCFKFAGSWIQFSFKLSFASQQYLTS